jgi:hypothetical protein
MHRSLSQNKGLDWSGGIVTLPISKQEAPRVYCSSDLDKVCFNEFLRKFPLKKMHCIIVWQLPFGHKTKRGITSLIFF